MYVYYYTYIHNIRTHRFFMFLCGGTVTFSWAVLRVNKHTCGSAVVAVFTGGRRVLPLWAYAAAGRDTGHGSPATL